MRKLRNAPAATPPKPEQLTDDELAMFNDLRTDAEQARALLDRYTRKLSQRYRLADGDGVKVDTGVITRAPRPALKEHVASATKEPRADG